jgi:hypothetical protein
LCSEPCVSNWSIMIHWQISGPQKLYFWLYYSQQASAATSLLSSSTGVSTRMGCLMVKHSPFFSIFSKVLLLYLCPWALEWLFIWCLYFLCFEGHAIA